MNPFMHSVVAAPLHSPREVWHQTSTVQLEQHPLAGQSIHTQGLKPGMFYVSGRSLWLRLLVMCCGVVTVTHVSAGELNSASAAELQSLKGIGPKTAALIVEERDRGGYYDDMQDLSERVRGLGPKKWEGLKEAGLTVEVPDVSEVVTKPPSSRNK